jgi:3-dehydroquinate dehydratase/shikimate dehydrogenase
MIVGIIHDCAPTEAAHRQRAYAEDADAFEVRLDLLSELTPETDLSPMFAHAPRPVIATCRAPWEGGNWRGSETERADLLQLAIAAGAAWVDVELTSEIELVRDLDETRLILSVHQFDGPTPEAETLLALAREAESRGADVFKAAFRANRLSDALLVREVCERAPIPSVVIAMGEAGLPSRIAYRALGCEWTYGLLSGSAPIAPGQIDVRTLRRRYRAHAHHSDTRLFGIAGRPIAHSRGLRYHNALFRADPELDALYLPLPTDDPGDLLRLARRLPLAGVSVTSPLKEVIAADLDDLTEAATATGSVNTITHDTDAGRLRGDNTDLPGAFDPLDAALGGPDAMRRRPALVLGAGGAARTVVTGLLQRGAYVFVLNRTHETAQTLAVELRAHGDESGGSVRAIRSLADVPAPVALIVNATTVGMTPHESLAPLDFAAAQDLGLRLTADLLVYDLIYAPAPTRFLAEASRLGHRTLDGRAMYERQAALQFDAWHTADGIPAVDPADEI